MAFSIADFGRLHPTPSYGWSVVALDFVPIKVESDGTVNIVGGGGGGGGLTDAQLRATPVPVSGPLTDAQLRAVAVPVSNAALTSIDNKTPTLGQQLAAASWPVVLTAAQVATLTPPAAITGFLTEADFDIKTGALTEAAPATDTASSGLNGRLQRIAQRLSTLITNLGSPFQAGGALGAGAAVIGKVGIDQTTPGTTNAVFVTGNGIVSTVNSTTANLAAAAVFTGTAEDVSTYTNISVSVFSSHASATDGLSVQQSPDGANWDQVDVYTIPATTGKTFNFGVSAKFFRLVYTNGATLTTSLRIQSIFTISAKRGSSIRPQDARTNDNDFEEVATYLNLFNGVSWDRARGTIANGIAADVTRIVAALPAGANAIGSVTANPPALTKGVQGAGGFSTQDLKDAGRNQTNFFMAAGVAGTAAEVMQSLTGYKSGLGVVATATPAVVTTGKTFRVTSITLTYQSLASAGGCIFRLRANIAGVGVAGSPLVASFTIGSTAAVAGVVTTEVIPLPDGMEFAAGTGIAVGMIGINTTGGALASGFGTITISGYEY